MNDEHASELLGQQSTASVVSNLHEILKPFLLRRVKTEGIWRILFKPFHRTRNAIKKIIYLIVAIDLPQKKEFLVYAPLSRRQKELYDASIRGLESLRQLLFADPTDTSASDAATAANTVDLFNTYDDEQSSNDGRDSAAAEKENNIDGSGSLVRGRRKRKSVGSIMYKEVSDATYFRQIAENTKEVDAIQSDVTGALVDANTGGMFESFFCNNRHLFYPFHSTH